MRAAEHAPRDPSRVLERRHGFAEIVERGIGVRVDDDDAGRADLALNYHLYREPSFRSRILP